jgi:hypothetical protein
LKYITFMPYGPPPRESPPKSRREARVKHVRIEVDLTQADYQALGRWLAGAAVELDQPVSSMTYGRGIRTMIRAAMADDAVKDVVLDLLRTEQS